MYLPDEWMRAMSKLEGEEFKRLTLAMNDVVMKGFTGAELGMASGMLLDMAMAYLRKQHDDRENGKRGGRPKKTGPSDDDEKGGFESEKGGFLNSETPIKTPRKTNKYKYKNKLNKEIRTRFHNFDQRSDDIDDYALGKMLKELGCDSS